MSTDEPLGPSRERSLGPAATVFLASLAGLFLDLALIRWVSSEIRVFAYLKNLALVASFLGFGTGCLLSRRRISASGPLAGLLLLLMLVRLPWRPLDLYGPRQVTDIMAELSGFMLFRGVATALPDWGSWGRLAFATGWTTVLFLLVAAFTVWLPAVRATSKV